MEATMTRSVVAPTSVRREGLAWAFAGVLMFSFSVPLTKVAVGGFSPFLTATGRAVIAGIAAGRAARRAAHPAASPAPAAAAHLHHARGRLRLADPARAGTG